MFYQLVYGVMFSFFLFSFLLSFFSFHCFFHFLHFIFSVYQLAYAVMFLLISLCSYDFLSSSYSTFSSKKMKTGSCAHTREEMSHKFIGKNSCLRTLSAENMLSFFYAFLSSLQLNDKSDQGSG